MFDSIKFFFIFTIIVIVIIIIIVAIVKQREHYKYEQRQIANEQRILDNVKKIKAEVIKWNRSDKVKFMNYMAKEYNKLKEASNKPFGAGWACETVIMIFPYDKEDFDCYSVDLDALSDLYHFVKRCLSK